MSNELVSIVIPAFNCAETIGAAVASCIDQTHANVEVIVVNDGSTDPTRDVLRGFDGRIRVIHQVNLGLAAARNAGHRAAAGNWVAWMDADDIAQPHRVQTQLAALRAVPEADVVCSDFSAFHDSREDFDASHINAYYGALRCLGGIAAVYPNEVAPNPDASGSPSMRWGNVYDGMLAGNFVHPPTVLLRRRLLEEMGECDCSLRYSSDYDFLLRASRLTRFAYVDAPLLRYRRHPGQMSHAAKSGKLQLETVRILQKASAEDVGLEVRRGADLRRFRAEALLSAAQALARTDRNEALQLFCAAQRHQVLPAPSLRALARIAAPNAAVDAFKRLCGKANPSMLGLPWCESMDFETLAEIARMAIPCLGA